MFAEVPTSYSSLTPKMIRKEGGGNRYARERNFGNAISSKFLLFSPFVNATILQA